jgi:hypothetical protein
MAVVMFGHPVAVLIYVLSLTSVTQLHGYLQTGLHAHVGE